MIGILEKSSPITRLADLRNNTVYVLVNPEEGTYKLCKVLKVTSNVENYRCVVDVEMKETWGYRSIGARATFRNNDVRDNGYFNFRKPTEQEATGMNYKTLATLANEANVTTAKVSFRSEQKEYTYKITRELAAKSIPGDLMVVANTSDTPYKILVLNSIDASPEVDVDDGVDYAWIADRLRTDDFDRALEMEQRISLALQKEHRRVTAKQAMDKLGMSGFDVTKALKNE